MVAASANDAATGAIEQAPASPEDLRVLYERHSAAIFGLALRILRDRGQAEDATQEVFVRLWQRPQRYVAERGSMRSFLMADCHGRAVDRLRSERARTVREDRVSTSELDVALDTVAQVAWQREIGTVLNTHLAALPPREAESIVLAYFGGRSYAEVALLLNEAEGTVKGRIRSGLRRMRVALVDSGEVADTLDS